MKWMCLACMLAAGQAMGQGCPEVPDHAAQISALLADLSQSRAASEAQDLNGQLWALWTDAPDSFAQGLLDEGMRQRAAFDLDGARITLGKLVDYCPDYAEGYNQRAFASYLMQDFTAALVDLDRALALNPTHIGAISGRGLTLIGLGRHDEAQQVLRQAVRMNPWLSERSLIVGPVETDI